MTSISHYYRYILVAFSVILLLCGLLSLFARHYWIFDIFTSFVPQYALLSGLLAFLLLLREDRKLASLMLLFAFVNVYQMHLFWKKEKYTGARGLYDKVTMLQFNVDGDNSKRTEVLTWLTKQSHHVDMVVLFGLTDKWQGTINKLSLLYPHHYVHSMLEEHDVAVFSKLSVKEFRIQALRNLDIPLLLVDLETDKHQLPWLLGIVHPKAPINASAAKTRNQVLTIAPRRMILQQKSYVTGKYYQSTVLAGDLNITPWSPYFMDMLKISPLKDAQNGRGLMGTWPAFLGDKFGIPIDHTLVSKNVHVLARDVGQSMGSSHLPVITTFGIPVKMRR